MEQKKILFVCTGNTCRSAMAAAMMADIGEKNEMDILVDSAGVFASIGECAADNAIAAMKKRDIDLSLHRTKPLTVELMEMADIVLVMTAAHKMLIENMAPDKVFTITEYAGLDGEIPDPYGGDLEEYEEVADELYDLLTDIAEKVWESK